MFQTTQDVSVDGSTVVDPAFNTMDSYCRGNVQLLRSAHIACAAANESPEGDDSGDLYIDPSGTIETTKGVPIAGATVTLARAATAGGALTTVPNGSPIMSPANRTNPSRSSALGAFGWDTVPGFYRITASHAGCAAPQGKGKRASTPVLGVPPSRSGLVLKLRCPRLRRVATRLTIRTVPGAGGGLVVRAKLDAPHATAATRVGSISVLARGHVLAVAALNPKTGLAVLDLPAGHRARALTVRFGGNGRYAPSRRRG